MIYEILEQSGAVGKQSAVKQADLCRRCGLRSSELKKIVQAERRNGALICSDSHGYYLPADRSETVAFYKATRAAAVSRFETLRTFRAALGLPEGQTEMTTDSLEGAANAETEDENS